jgi:transmembrane sensor
MTGPTPPDWDAIARYLAGESSADEATVVRGWLEKNPLDRELVERLNTAAVIDAPVAPADVDVEAALARVHHRMAEHERPRLTLAQGGAQGAKPGSRFKSAAWIAGIAAAAAAFFVATRQRADTTPARDAAVAQSYSTGVGRRQEVRLADGSRVVLGPQSKLTVHADFATARRVDLTGDGYFDVVHDAAKPFTVRSGSAIIEDIGTTFTVESDAGSATNVSVVSGSVRLRGGNSAATAGVILAAGDRGSLEAGGKTSVERNAVRDEDTAWITGRLAFRDAPLSRIAAELHRWYGVTLRVTDSTLLARHVTTSFEGESVEQALRILALTIDARISRQGDTATVIPNRGTTTSR